MLMLKAIFQHVSIKKGKHTMFQRILVPLDGSARAERAVPVAARLAQAAGGIVILVRVVSKSNPLWPGKGQPRVLIQRLVQEKVFDADQHLRDIVLPLHLQDVQAETVVQVGSTIPAILAVVETFDIDLILLCSHGYTGMRRRIVGSVAQRLTHDAPVPVLVLREDGPVPGELSQDTGCPLRALVPLDGTAHAKAALEPAANLVAALSASEPAALHLLRVVQPVTTAIEEGGMLTASEQARRYLSATAEHIREGYVAPAVAELGLNVTWSVAVDTYVAETLVKAAEQVIVPAWSEMGGDVDVIALATQDRDGLQRWAMGSVTEHILLSSKLPLLVVPSRWQGKTVEREPEQENEDAVPLWPTAVPIS
jgi:nucleotide-binding universal stress UspA family protein